MKKCGGGIFRNTQDTWSTNRHIMHSAKNKLPWVPRVLILYTVREMTTKIVGINGRK